MLITWRKLIMAAIFTSILCWVLIQWRQGSPKTEETPKPQEPRNDTFLELLEQAPARSKPEELYKVVHSPSLATYSECDLVDLMQEAVQTYFHPNMGEEETKHVRETFIKTLGSLSLLQSNRLYGGQSNGQHENAGAGIT